MLLYGTQSRVFSWAHAEEMARRRPNTTLVHIDAGHAIYFDNPDAFAAEIRKFLQGIGLG
ncbi:hypothetical protein PLACP1_07770 [Planifilum fimeticola]